MPLPLVAIVSRPLSVSPPAVNLNGTLVNLRADLLDRVHRLVVSPGPQARLTVTGATLPSPARIM